MPNTARTLTFDPSPRLLWALSLPLLVALMFAYSGGTLAGEADLPDVQSIDVLAEESVAVETIASEEVVIEASEVEDHLLPPYDPANPQMPLMDASEVELDEELMIPTPPEGGVSPE